MATKANKLRSDIASGDHILHHSEIYNKHAFCTTLRQ